jgi:signal transduction histidine kinase
MIRWLPQSLFGRLVLILLAGLIVAQILAASLSFYERDQALVYFTDRQWAERDADLVSLLDRLPPSEQSLVASIRTSPRVRIRLFAHHPPPDPHALPQDSRARRFLRLLEKLLPHHRITGYLLREPVPAADRLFPFEYGYRTRSLFQVRLDPAGWVRFNYLRPLAVTEWPYPLIVYLGVLGVGIILLSLWAVRLATRPLRDLASAAEDLGRNIHRSPMPERGPIEVQRAARAFNGMQNRLSQFIEDRTRLLTAISHDLRTPITRMRLRSELLDDPGLREKFVRDLAEMEAMTRQTLDFLQGLDIAEEEQPIDLSALLETIVADLGEQGLPATLNGSLPHPIPGRPSLLRRLFENLIHNALTYGGRAEIGIHPGDRNVEVRIRDHGPGIPFDRLEKVLEPYYRLDPSRGHVRGGFGLGLSIARNIAETHGGQLVLRNHPDGGLEARVILPLARQPGNRRPAPIPEPQAVPNPLS